MKTIEELRATPRLIINDRDVAKDGFAGTVSLLKWSGSVICSTGAGWEHVSVSPHKKQIMPSWEDMCAIKDMFWGEDEAVIQIHPPKAEYVNSMPNCLHLWRCTYKEMVLPGAEDTRKGDEEMNIQQAIAELRDFWAGCDHEDPNMQDGITALAMGIKALKAIEEMKDHISGIETIDDEECEDPEPTYLSIECEYANKEKQWCNYRNAPIENCWACCYVRDVWNSGKFALVVTKEHVEDQEGE